MKPLSFALAASTLILGFLYFTERQDRVAARFLLEMRAQESGIQNAQISDLEDQIHKVQFEAMTKGTFEQGYTAALVRSGQPGTYADGYADARSKFESKDYVAGYHNAVEQFGGQWFPNGTLPAEAKQPEPKGGVEAKEPNSNKVSITK